jgi:hypothetical protein
LVSYSELGHIRGIGRESAVKLVQRKRWRRVLGNDGETRVAVPLDWLTPAKEPSGEHSPESSPGTSAVETVLSALREAHTTEIERLTGAKDGEIGRLTEALTRSDGRIDALIAGHRDEIVAIEAKLTAAEDQARIARAEADLARRETLEAQEATEAAERQTEAERARVDEARTDLAVAQADGTTLAIEAKRLRGELQDTQAVWERLARMERADAERKGRGLLARLRDALRGS